MSDAKPILLDIADGVATITINRPQVKNSLNIEALSALFTTLGTCEDRSDVGAIVLPGVLVYQAFSYWVFRRRVASERIPS